MHNNNLFKELHTCLKILYKNRIHLPDQGTQAKYLARKSDDEREEFTIVINRKGRLNPDYLTYQISSRHGILVRIDMNGQPHENGNSHLIETPHIHIFNEPNNLGATVLPLCEIVDIDLLATIVDSLKFFLEYNNISTNNIEMPLF